MVANMCLPPPPAQVGLARLGVALDELQFERLLTVRPRPARPPLSRGR
jgi:hypothetical protein